LAAKSDVAITFVETFTYSPTMPQELEERMETLRLLDRAWMPAQLTTTAHTRLRIPL
jgi:hypothetical protein